MRVRRYFDSTVSPLTDLTLAAWALVEVGVRVREGVQGKGRAARDRGTRVLIAMALGAAIVAAVAAHSVAPELRMPASLRMAGVLVMWLGLALRIWAIASLGSAFRTTVEVEPGQGVVSSGPYRLSSASSTWMRHTMAGRGSTTQATSDSQLPSAAPKPATSSSSPA